MALGLETVVQQLTDSGVIAQGQLDDFIPPKAHPKNVEELVTELVKQNHLTKFQAVQVAAGKAKSLILGGYTILDKIGAGGMGQVFKAHNRRMDRLVAIKMLPPAMTKDVAAVARFEREVRAAAKLRHSNIVAADDADQANGVHFLVMEYVEGQDLSSLVKKSGPLDVDKAVRYLLHAARGLEYAHSEGVIHRDIKPANLLVDKKGTVKILDMGLARIEGGGDVGAQAELTGTGAVMGTVDYMAPEQALSTKHADARADVYSLGCTLHYFLTGKPPYTGDTLMARLLAHREEPIPSLRAANGDVGDELERIFQKLLAKKIDDRYQTMSELIVDLERLTGAGSSITSNTTGAPQVSNSLDSGLVTFLKDLPQQTTRKSITAKPEPQLAAGLDPARSSAPSTPNRSTARGQAPRLNKKLAAMIGGGIVVCAGLIVGLVFALRNPPTEHVAFIPAVKAPPPAPINYALEFGGQGYVTTPIRFEGTHPITVEAYVTPSASPGTTIISDADGPGGFSLESGGSGKVWQTRISLGPSISTAAMPIVPLKPVHLAGVWDGKTVTLYVDGVGQPSSPALQAQKSGMPFLIGAEPNFPQPKPPYFGTTQNNFRGIIDEVRVSKTARYTGDFKPEKRFTPDADTMALYHFDEGASITARDASGNGNDGAIFGAKWVRPLASAPGGWTSATGAGGYALDFDGRTSVATTPVKLDGKTPFTVEAWAKPRNIQAKGRQGVVSDESNNGFFLGYGDGHWQMSGLIPEDETNVLRTVSSKSPVDLSLVHLAGVYDGVDIHLYVNGVWQGSKPCPNYTASSYSVGLGCDPSTPGNERDFFNGMIDEVRISKTVRYKGNFTPQKRFEPDADTLGLYHCDEGSGEVLLEAANKRSNGKIVSAKWVASPLDPPSATAAANPAAAPNVVFGGSSGIKASPPSFFTETPAVPPSGPGGVVYVDDMKEIEWKWGHGPLGTHGAGYSGKPILWHGRTIAHSLYTSPKPNTPETPNPASVAYALDARYESLSAAVGIADSSNGSNSPLTFRVLGDGRELWKSPPIQKPTDEATFSVSVAGVRELRLEVAAAAGATGAHAVWIEPKLTSLAPAQPPAPR